MATTLIEARDHLCRYNSSLLRERYGVHVKEVRRYDFSSLFTFSGTKEGHEFWWENKEKYTPEGEAIKVAFNFWHTYIQSNYSDWAKEKAEYEREQESTGVPLSELEDIIEESVYADKDWIHF